MNTFKHFKSLRISIHRVKADILCFAMSSMSAVTRWTKYSIHHVSSFAKATAGRSGRYTLLRSVQYVRRYAVDARSIPTMYLIALSLLCCSSCVSFKPERETLAEDFTPAEFSSNTGVEDLQTQWWKAFKSEQLNHLMENAFQDNLTLEQAAARLEQAEASVRKSGAAGKIQINGEAESSSRYTSNDNGSYTDPYHSVGLYASYELDLWGKLKSSEQAALASRDATKFDLQTAAMTLSSELTQTYFQWLAQNEALGIYQSQLKSNRNKLTALERRYHTGQATSLALLQQRQQVAAAEAKIPPVQALIESSEHSTPS